MTALLDIDFLADERLRARLARWSLAIFAVGLLTSLLLAVVLAPDASPLGPALQFLLLVAATLVSMPVHELVHALFFRLMGGRGTRVRFGHAAGMLYAGCPGLVLPRARFLCVLLAPAVLVTGVLVLLGMVFDLHFIGMLAAAIHLSSCTGDLLAAWLIAREPACTHCEDTEVGVRLLAAGA